MQVKLPSICVTLLQFIHPPLNSHKNLYPILAAIHNTGLNFLEPGGEEAATAAIADALFPSLQAYRLTIADVNTANSK